MPPPLRILICRSDRIGDNICSLPVAADLKQAFPDCRITWLAKASVAPLVRMDPNVAEVMEWDDNTDPDALLPRLTGQFDAAVVLYPKPKRWLALAATLRTAGIRIRVGTGLRWWGLLLYTHRTWSSRHRGGIHERVRSRQHGRVLLRALGGDTSVCDRPARTGLTVPPAELALAREWFRQLHLERPVLLHLGCTASMEWPTEYMAELADRLTELGVPVLISTGLRRPDLEQAMTRACVHPHPFTPQEPRIEQLAAWLSLCGCVVAGSTGPLHLAGALGTPTVGLFPCCDDCLPAQWGPMGEGAINLVAPTPPGGMPRRRYLADPDQLRGLSVTTVLEAVLSQRPLDLTGAAAPYHPDAAQETA
jgi:ADP-heptose:LPS heptosyltransferase